MGTLESVLSNMGPQPEDVIGERVAQLGYSVEIVEWNGGFLVERHYHPTGEIYTVEMPTLEAAEQCKMAVEVAIYHVALVHFIRTPY